jgi:UDP-glucose 6-dehydrogenase
LLDQVWNINEQQKEILFRKLWNYYQGQLTGKVVAIWGHLLKKIPQVLKTLQFIPCLLHFGRKVQL